MKIGQCILVRYLLGVVGHIYTVYIASCVYMYIYIFFLYNIYILLYILCIYIYDISFPLELFRLKWALLIILVYFFFLMSVGRERFGMVPVGFMLPP